MLEELIQGRSDLRLAVEKRRVGTSLEVIFPPQAAGQYLLHWGFARARRGAWQAPPQTMWPGGTQASGSQAVQTPFPGTVGDRQLILRFEDAVPVPYLVFDLFCPETKRWENNRGQDYFLSLSEAGAAAPKPSQVLEQEQPRATGGTGVCREGVP